jgi:hypothetical protein
MGHPELVLFNASMPKRALSLKEPPVTLTRVSAPLTKTPEPPLLPAVTLFKATLPGLFAVIEIPFELLSEALTFVSATSDPKI